jgi:hypothetical protein
MWKKAFGFCSTALSLTCCGGTADTDIEAAGQIQDPLVRGTPVPVSDVPSIGRPYVVLVVFQTNDGFYNACSGTYFAPRVVLTAAHCVPPGNVFRGLVYWGNDLEADFGQIFGPVPPPGEPSLWAELDSWEVNPGFTVNPFDADMAVLYLDRKPPFDPLPLYRNRIDSSWTGQLATLVGWGANEALSEDTQQNTGFGVKRTGKAPIVGTPTLADYQPDPSEVPLLTPTVRSHSLKLNGSAPHVNVCAGDSGGPILVNRWGQDYIAGVASRTGPWCENISIYTRIDPYLPFLDTAYRRGGQEKVIPSLDCVDTRGNGKLTAYFGYKNDNGVSITVPYGFNTNYLPLDVTNERPTLFKPGNKRFQVGIDFNPGQTVIWRLNPSHSPSTEVRATASSPRCGDDKGRRCARYCEATMASECIDDFNADWQFCIDSCLDGYRQWENECEDEWATFLSCVASTPPAEENWLCIPFFDTMPRPLACDVYVEQALDCLYPPL